VGEERLPLESHDAGIPFPQLKPGPFQKGLAVEALVGGEDQVVPLGIRQEELRRFHAQGLPQGPQEVLNPLSEALGVAKEVLGKPGKLHKEIGGRRPLGVKLHQIPAILPVPLAPEAPPLYQKRRAGPIGPPPELPLDRAPDA
jgi:hypothetical protein